MQCIFCHHSPSTHEPVRRTFHRFPSEPQARKVWLQLLQLQEDQICPNDDWLCSDHFARGCFSMLKNGSQKLHPQSVPTVFNNQPARFSTCCYCKSPKSKKNSRNFYRFPLNTPGRLNKWLSAIPLPNFLPTKYDWLCSKHFQTNCFLRSGIKLHQRAVPSLFQSIHDLGEDSKNQSENSNNFKTENVFRENRAWSPESTDSEMKFPDLEYHSENNNDCEIKIEENGATNHVESADSNNTDSEMEVTGLTLPSKDSEDHSEKGNDSETETNVFRENETTNQMDSQESTNSETELGGLALPIEEIFVSDTTESEAETGTRNVVLYPENFASDITESEVETKTANRSKKGARRKVIQSDHVIHQEIEFISCAVLETTNNITPETQHNAVHVEKASSDNHNNDDHSKTTKTPPQPNQTIGSVTISIRSSQAMNKQLATNIENKNKLARENYYQTKRIKRLQSTATSLKDTVRDLRKKLLAKKTFDSLDNWEISQLLRVCNRNTENNREKYPLSVRTFALTLHNHSPQAYNFVREQFRNALPDTNTLRLWDKSVICEPKESTYR